LELVHFLLEFLSNTRPVLEEMVNQYGTLIYIILFLIIFMETGVVVMPLLPGDSLLFSIGCIAASTAGLDIRVIIPLLIIAALVGDNLNYFIGKKFGDFIQKKEKLLFLKREHIEETEKYFEKYGTKTVILARYIPIVRTIAPFVAGAGEMKYRTYLIYCFIGACLWVCSITLLGYFLGNIPIIKNNFEKVVLGIVFLSVLPIIIKLIQSKLRKSNT